MAINNNKVSVNLEFIENHRPGIKAGDYTFNVTQKLAGPGITGKDDSKEFQLKHDDFHVSVKGEQFNIKPTEIHSVFPPENTLGEYSNVLPHIIINRSTLPWERMAIGSVGELTDQDIPWLALLVFNADELVNKDGVLPSSPDELQEVQHGKAVTFSNLNGKSGKGKIDLNEELLQDPNEKINVVYVKAETLKDIVPQRLNELKYLAHARQACLGITPASTEELTAHILNSKKKLVHVETFTKRKEAKELSINPGPLKPGTYTINIDYTNGSTPSESYSITLGENDQVGSEAAVIMANRLPAKGAKSIVHLVSVENRYDSKGNFITSSEDVVPLVSLKSWSFNSVNPKQSFREILLHVNHPFLFGFDAAKVTSTPAIGKPVPLDIREAFLTGNVSLGKDAKIHDIAALELQDQDHQYFIGNSGTVYLSTGKATATKSKVSAHTKTNSSMIGNLPITAGTPAQATSRLNFWIQDGKENYFIRQQQDKGRVEVIYIPQDQSPTLRLPEVQDSTAENYLKQGYAPFPHFFRRGSKNISWYRSPLLPGKPPADIDDTQFPAHDSDELLRYFDKEGMFDVSYAAAWELGRLQALKSKRFSVSLYNWKRTHSQQFKAAIQQEAHAHLPFQHNAQEKVAMPKNIELWLRKLSLLKGLPFNYLVPDERMLPVESIRYFYLDPSWVACLIDGAMSIGRVAGQAEPTHKPGAFLDTTAESQPITGILLRSAVVKGWPALQINGYNHSNWGKDDNAKNNTITENNKTIEDGGVPVKPLPILRMERLSPNVLLCLFKGEANVVDIHEKPEVVHFGFMEKESGSYSKEAIASNGNQDANAAVTPSLNAQRRVDINKLFADIQAHKSELGYTAFTSAQFALSMVEGVDRVRFIMR